MIFPEDVRERATDIHRRAVVINGLTGGKVAQPAGRGEWFELPEIMNAGGVTAANLTVARLGQLRRHSGEAVAAAGGSLHAARRRLHRDHGRRHPCRQGGGAAGADPRLPEHRPARGLARVPRSLRPARHSDRPAHLPAPEPRRRRLRRAAAAGLERLRPHARRGAEPARRPDRPLPYGHPRHARDDRALDRAGRRSPMPASPPSSRTRGTRPTRRSSRSPVAAG